MDLNYLLYRHQVSLMRAHQALCRSSRVSHEGMAAAYAEQINDTRDAISGHTGRLVMA